MNYEAAKLTRKKPIGGLLRDERTASGGEYEDGHKG